MNIVDLPSRFWSYGDVPLRYIVLHTTEGTDSRTWLTETGNVSAHYLVRGSVVYRLVDEDNEAWHAGIISGDPTTDLYTGVNPNEESIGVEIEGFAAQPLTNESIQTTAALIKDIWFRRGPLPLVAHYHLSPGNRTDPGEANYTRVVDAAREEPLSEEYKQALQAELVQMAYEPITQLQLDLAAALGRIAALEGEKMGDHQHTVRLNATMTTQ